MTSALRRQCTLWWSTDQVRTLPDSELIELARLDDRTAFETLLLRYDDRMRGLAYRLLTDRAAMDDVMHETYLAAHRSLDRVRPVGDVFGWLFRLTYNACVDALRASGEDRRPDAEDDPAGASEVVRAALRDLPVDQRLRLVLIDGEGLSSAKVAEILGVAPRTVATRLGRARTTVRSILEADLPMTGDTSEVQEPELPEDEDPLVSEAEDADVGAVADPSDTLVETALRLLPVPEHAPGFWEDLDAALAAEPRRQVHEPSLAVGPGHPAARPPVNPSAAPPRQQRLVAAPLGHASLAARRPTGTDPTRQLVPPSLRRRSNAVLVVLVMAAISLVVICGVALVRSRADAGLGDSPAVSPTVGVAGRAIAARWH